MNYSCYFHNFVNKGNAHDKKSGIILSGTVNVTIPL